MDTISYLLKLIFKLVLGLFLLVGILWLVGALYPQFKLSELLKGGLFTSDWLPAPKNYANVLTRPPQDGVHGFEYTSSTFYQHPNTGYVGYTAATSSNNQVFSGNTSAYTERSSYIRNLSVYEGGNISYGATFVGEARDTMFRNGIFSILVVDGTGRVLAATQGINTGTWATPGWARFQATIPVQLPKQTPCALIFMSAQQQTQVRMNVRCN